MKQKKHFSDLLSHKHNFRWIFVLSVDMPRHLFVTRTNHPDFGVHVSQCYLCVSFCNNHYNRETPILEPYVYAFTYQPFRKWHRIQVPWIDTPDIPFPATSLLQFGYPIQNDTNSISAWYEQIPIIFTIWILAIHKIRDRKILILQFFYTFFCNWHSTDPKSVVPRTMQNFLLIITPAIEIISPDFMFFCNVSAIPLPIPLSGFIPGKRWKKERHPMLIWYHPPEIPFDIRHPLDEHRWHTDLLLRWNQASHTSSPPFTIEGAPPWWYTACVWQEYHSPTISFKSCIES